MQSQTEWSGVEERMSSNKIMCMASGCLGTVRKYYFFAQEDSSGTFFLVEAVGEPAKGRLIARFKTEAENVLPHFLRHFKLSFSRALALPAAP